VFNPDRRYSLEEVRKALHSRLSSWVASEVLDVLQENARAADAPIRLQQDVEVEARLNKIIHDLHVFMEDARGRTKMNQP